MSFWRVVTSLPSGRPGAASGSFCPRMSGCSIRCSGSVDQRYDPAAVNTFLQVADFYLVAHALGHEYVVVTHEVPSDAVRKVKIPNVCIGLKVRCMTPYEMLRRERARFVLGP